MDNIRRIGKKINELYYFQKVKNMRQTNRKIYLLFPPSRKVEK